MQDVREDIGAILIFEGEGRQFDCGHGWWHFGGQSEGDRLHGTLLHPQEDQKSCAEDNQGISGNANVPQDLLQTTGDGSVLIEFYLRQELKRKLFLK